MIGESIGNYRVTGKIGAGGMGAVYLAEHQLIGRKAALKVLLPDLSASKRQVQRFFNEAKAASAIRHPGIVEIFDFGFHRGQAFILMEFLEGESLHARLRRDSVLTQHAALHLLRQVAGCLAAAHEQGIIHRDLKPDNIFIVADPEVSGGERVKLLDFGIAKLSGEHSNDMKTRTGTVMGTPSYMSPEQCRGAEQVDARSDLYSLGCIMYRMLCGQPPFVSKYSGDIIAMQIMYDPPDPRSLVPDMPAPIAGFIARLLSKDPARRPQSARALMGEVDQLGHVTLASGMHGRMPTNHEYVSQHSQRTPLTTLAGSSGVVGGALTVAEPERQRRRSPVLLAVLAVAAAAGFAVFAASMFSSKADQSAAPRPGAVNLPDDVPESPAEELAAHGTEQVEGHKSAGDLRDDGDKRVVKIVTDPEGAQVTRGDEMLGKTPLNLSIAAAEEMTLTVHLPGYIGETIEIPNALDPDGRVTIAMQPVPAPDPAVEPGADDPEDPPDEASDKPEPDQKKVRRTRRKSTKKREKKSNTARKRDADGFIVVDGE